MKNHPPDFSDISDSKHWRNITFLDKGWSADKKYYIETDVDKKLIIRLADISQYEKKKTEYETMQAIYRLGIDMSQPIDFGTCDSGKMVYILLSWVEGESAEDTLSELNSLEQRNYGIAAGQILKKIHSVSAPENQPSWESRITRKVEMKMSQYRNCGYAVPNDGKMMNFINNNLQYLRDMPQTLQHGDFHPGNLIITQHNTLAIIDFNRIDFGDPYEEFVRVTTFTKNISIPFAIGQINGYFGKRAPELFFRLMALYSAIDAHFGIIWAIPFGQDDIEKSLIRSKSVFEDYRGFETYVPLWYS